MQHCLASPSLQLRLGSAIHRIDHPQGISQYCMSLHWRSLGKHKGRCNYWSQATKRRRSCTLEHAQRESQRIADKLTSDAAAPRTNPGTTTRRPSSPEYVSSFGRRERRYQAIFFWHVLFAPPPWSAHTDIACNNSNLRASRWIKH